MATIKERLHEHKRRQRIRFWTRVLVIAGLGWGLHNGWNYLHQPGLAVGELTLHGSNLVSVEEAIRFGGGEPPFNFFNFSARRLLDALDNDVRIASARSTYRFPFGYDFYITEREPALYVANSYRSYLLVDRGGYVMNVVTGIPDACAPILVGAQCGNVYLGDSIDNEAVEGVLEFLKLLDAEARDRIAEIAIDNRNEVKLRLRNSFPILLGPVGGLTEKAEVFKTVFNEIKNKNIQAEYIDLTFAKPYIRLLPEKDKI